MDVLHTAIAIVLVIALIIRLKVDPVISLVIAQRVVLKRRRHMQAGGVPIHLLGAFGDISQLEVGATRSPNGLDRLSTPPLPNRHGPAVVP